MIFISRKIISKIFIVLAILMSLQMVITEKYTEANSTPTSESVSAIEGDDQYTLLVDATSYRGAKQVGDGTPPREKGHVANVRYFVGNTTGRTYFCIEPGVIESGREYKYIGSFNSMYSNKEVSAFISYAMFNNIDKLDMQLGVWNILGYASIPLEKQKIIDQFRTEYRSNSNSKIFEGSKVYVLDAVSNAQHRQRLITFDYERHTSLNIRKIDKDGRLITSDTAGFRFWWDENKTNPVGMIGSKGEYSYLSGSKSNTIYTKLGTGIANVIGIPKNSVIYAEEIKAPSGFNRSSEIRKYDLTSSTQLNFTREWRNIKDTLTLKKLDENGKLITGQTTGFELYWDSKFTKSFNVVGSSGNYEYNSSSNSNTVYTNASTGILKINEVPDGTTIYAKEVKTPIGYKTTTNQLKFDMTKDGVINHIREVVNERIKIQIAKVDEQGELITSSHTIFRLYKDKEFSQVVYVTGSSGIYNYDGLTKKPTNQMDVLTIPNKGFAELSGFPEGTYYLKEIKAPEGYILDANGQMFEVNTKEDLDALVVEVENISQKAKLVIEKKAQILKGIKVERGETKPVFEEGYLAGTRWQLTAKEDIYSKDTQTLLHKKGEIVKDGVTENKALEFKNIALGKYELREVLTDEKYVLDKNVEEIDFVSEGQEIKFVSKTTSKVNERKNIKFEIVKEFEDSNIFERNPKATFGLFLKVDYQENGITIPKDTLLDTITLDSKDVEVESIIDIDPATNEVVERFKRTVKGTFENQLIDGVFYVKELSTDDDYLLDDQNHEVEFNFKDTDQKDNKVVTEIENKLNRITLKVVKVEMGSNKEIVVEESRYRLIAVDEVKGNTVIGEYVTNHLGEINIEALENGNYYLEEVLTTDDYFLNEEKIDIDLSASKDGEVVEKIVENEKKPKIKTSANDNETGKKEIDPINLVEIKDIVTYKDLIIGKDYTIKGKLMDKLTNSPLLDKDGNEITAELTFKADRRNGEIELIFKVDATLLRGKEVVLFEKLFREDIEVAIHEDINDENQTVRITNPTIGTTLATVDGLKEVFGEYKVTLVDKVEYKDLVVGKEYTLELVLMNKATGEPIMINGETAKVTKTFIAQTKDGVVEVEIEVDLSMFKVAEIVAFEKLFYDGVEIANHEDINDENQTIEVVASELPLTGSEKLARNMLIATFVMTTVFLVYIITKKKEEVKG